MKPTSVIRRLLVGAGCMSVLLCTTAIAAENASEPKHYRHEARAAQPRVVLVRVTGSWIPQRVVVAGQQVNSASPLFVMQGNDLHRRGSSTLSGMLSLDPSITYGGRR